MGYDRTAPKRAVNMSLNEDLVRQARGLTANLSETVEHLLANFIDAADARIAEQERQIATHLAASDEFTRKYGSLADEYDEL
jgi:antitoxin CcdA